MEPWQWTSILLCGFGLFKEFRPSEPFLTPFLLEYRNVTQEELVQKAYPSYTYTYLATLAVVFIVTDYVRYKPVVILEGIAYVVTWIFLSWGKGLLSVMVCIMVSNQWPNEMKFVEFFYGIACSTEVAYYTYIYAKVDKEHFAKVTSYTYSAVFAGRFFGGVVGQLFVYFDWMNYLELNYISLGCVSTALAFSLFLPTVQRSIYFHRNDPTQSEESALRQPEGKITLRQKLRNSKRYMIEDLKSAYKNSYVLKWSIWWAVSTAGHLQCTNYIQPLWEVIVTESGSGSQEYNGAVEATHTLISSILAFGVGHVKISWKTWGEALLSISALAQFGALIWTSQTNSLLVAYGCYIMYRILFQVIITVASAEVAQGISEDSFGLIFGINTFIALTIQTIGTLVVADEAGLALSVRSQYVTYAVCHGVLGAAFAISLMINFCFLISRNRNQEESDNINQTS